MKKYLLLSFLFISIFSLTCHAQDDWTSYDVLTTNTGDNGLIGQYILSFMEDDQGRLWIGTEAGISIKSETGWESLTTSDGLKVNEIGDMVMDNKNRIWIGYGSYLAGVSVYQDGKFTNYNTSNFLLHNKVEDIILDDEGYVWIASWGNIIKTNGTTWISYTPEDGLPDDKIMNLAQDQNGNIWIGTFSSGLWIYNGNTFSQNCWEDNSDDWVKDIYVDSENTIWASSISSGIFRNESGSWEKIFGTGAAQITKDQNGNLFFALCTGGITKYNNSQWSIYTTEDGLIDDSGLSLFTDSKNVVYFGTNNGYATFNGETWDAVTTSGLISNDINEIFKDQEGKTWFCTQGGISILDGEDWTNFSSTPDNGSLRWTTKGLQDKSGNYWFATVSGIYKYDGTTWTNYDRTTNNIFTDWWQDILEDNEGNLWFAGWNYLLKFDGESWTHYNEKDGFQSNYIDGLYQGSDGKIWIGTRGGIYYWNGTNFIHDTDSNSELTGKSVYSFIEDADGNLIASTYIGLFIKNNGVWERWENSPSGWFRDSYKDKNNIIWFASTNGLYKYEGNEFIRYTSNDGLAGNTINDIYREEDTGIFWFSTSNGISKLVPDVVAEINDEKSAQTTYSVQIESQGITKPFQFSSNGSEFIKNDGLFENLEAGDYTFYVTNAYDTITIEYTVKETQTGIEDFNHLNIGIYPNPTSGLLRIDGQNLNKVEVFNINGIKILSKDLNPDANYIDISELEDAIYIISIIEDDNIYQKKIIKQK